MSRLPKDVADFMQDHGVHSDEIWLVPGGKAYAIKHKALERIAAARGVVFDVPQIVEAHGEAKIATIIVTGRLGERIEWSFGEASPANNKNAYAFSMAEKRGKDRVILKLLNAHGAVYSEDEADDFKEPRTTREQYEAGSYYENPDPNFRAQRQTSNAIKKNDPDFWPTLEREVRACNTLDDLRGVFKAYRDRVEGLPISWQEQWDNLLMDQRTAISAKVAA